MEVVMVPDVIQIGNHYYALILNLIITTFFGLMGSIVYFRYQRKIKRRDAEKLKLEETATNALSALVTERHDTLIKNFDDTRKTIVNKIDAHCVAQEKWQIQVDDRFHSHAHMIKGDIADDIIMRKVIK
jgi:hypothetical protein